MDWCDGCDLPEQDCCCKRRVEMKKKSKVKNGVAKDLRTPKYKMKVVQSKKVYTRKSNKTSVRYAPSSVNPCLQILQFIADYFADTDRSPEDALSGLTDIRDKAQEYIDCLHDDGVDFII